MHQVANTLAAKGITAVAMDVRGHGASGTRGDIAYLGQLDDDLMDLVAKLRKTDANATFSLIGHSSGAGFVLRIAGGPDGRAFERFVLLAPYLGYSAPTNRPAEGPALWASPDLPRIFATILLEQDRHRLAAVPARDRLRQSAGGEDVRHFRLFVPSLAELYSAARLEGRIRQGQGASVRRSPAPTTS